MSGPGRVRLRWIEDAEGFEIYDVNGWIGYFIFYIIVAARLGGRFSSSDGCM